MQRTWSKNYERSCLGNAVLVFVNVSESSLTNVDRYMVS